MRVVGIDPSISGTALVCFENFIPIDQLRITTSKEAHKEQEEGKNNAKKLSTDEMLDRIDREYEIYKRTLEFLTKNKPDIIAIEGYNFMGHNLAIQAEVVGSINISIKRYTKYIGSLPLEKKLRGNKDFGKKVQVVFFTPQSLKKYILGKGTGGKKELVIKEVYKQFNYDTDDNNIADAFVLGKLGSDFGYLIRYKDFRKDMKSYQKEIFKNIFITKDLVKSIMNKKKEK